MNLISVSARGMRRTPVRMALTVVAAVATILCFVLLRTILDAYSFFLDRAAVDRLYTRHKISAAANLPRRDLEALRAVPGAKHVAFITPLALRSRSNETGISAYATEPEAFLEVFDEVVLDEGERRAWFETRTGAVVGDVLAKKLDVKVGSTLPVRSRHGDMTLQIVGIYEVSGKSTERTAIFLHWAYLNDLLPERERESAAIITTVVAPSANPATVGAALDAKLQERGTPTTTVSERDFSLQALSGVSSILRAVNFASVLILAVMALILGNTIAMSTRERTKEFGILRAIGFKRRHIALFVLFEATILGLVAGVLGAATAYPVIELMLGRWLEENVGDLVPYFRIDPVDLIFAVVLATAISTLASALPARTASRMSVVDVLRRRG